MAKNSLRYSICEELLYGEVAGVRIAMRAFSGGGRESTAGAERKDLKHWSTTKKAPEVFDYKNRGGPLPAGLYLASYYGAHPHLGECAALIQTLSSLLHRDYYSTTGVSVTDRAGFFVHGVGPKGSDGCIVPETRADLTTLLSALKKAAELVVLVVHLEGMNARIFEAAQKSQHAV